MPKPPSSCNELSKEISPIASSNQVSPQPHLPPLIDPYVNVVLQANQNRNETQPQLPPSPNRDMLVDEINQLQDLSNLLAMHLSNHTTNPTPSTPILPHTITFDQVEHHIGYCPMMKRAKDIENMTIAEYMQYEAELKRQSRRSAQSSHLKRYEGTELNSSHCEKNIALEYPYYSNYAKIDAYYDLPPLLPCFQLVQKPYRYDPSFIANVEDDKGKVLPCQIPPKELNPGSFTLPCTIRNLNFYAMADLGASVNVIPKSIFKFLKLTHLKKTNMLVEMADMTKRVPIGIVENVLFKIDKFLFPSNFVVIDMLEAQTMILGRPFLATINAEINVFNKEISLGIGEDRITFNMDKKIHNFTTPIEKVHVINLIENGESCISRAYNQHESTQDNDDIQGRCGKMARIDDTNPTITKVCNGGEDIYGIDEKGKLREWYCHHDDKRRRMTGEGLSFPDYLLVKYGGNQGSDLIWDKSYAEWCNKNSISSPSTSKLSTTQLDNKPKPRDYTFKQWMLIKVGHTNVNESVKRAFLKSCVIDCFEAELRPAKDPRAKSFDDYKWVFDLEIDQLADEYELGIGKKGIFSKKFKKIVRKFEGMTHTGGSHSKEVEFEVISTHNHVVEILLQVAFTA
ncbi:phospholipase-like protein [Tanacetum coccineum]